MSDRKVATMAHELEVRLFSSHVGTLVLTDGRLGFRYASTWLAQSNAVALSASLPLQAEPFDDRQARPFFAGLLPEAAPVWSSALIWSAVPRAQCAAGPATARLRDLQCADRQS